MIRMLMVCLAFALPAKAATEIVEVTSPGGITAWLVQEPSIPMVALQLSFRGGTSIDAPGKAGAINLMTGLLEEGAGDMDAQAFLEAEEALAARFSYGAYRDSVSIDAEMLTETLDESVELLRLAMIEPRFDDVAVERVRRQVLSIIDGDATDPDSIASKTLREISYAGHPYAASSEGTRETVEALTRDDLIAAHKAALVKDRVFVGVVGDITPERLGELLDQLLGELPNTGPELPGKTSPLLDGGVDIVDFDVPQSVAVFGHEGISRDDPDFLQAYILFELFGGSGFSSRLMTEVREKRGLTYGVYAFLAPSQSAQMVMGSLNSSNETMAEAIDVIRQEWRKIGETGISQSELDKAKLFLTGAYPLRFDSNVKIAGILVGLQVVGLPIDYVANRNALVEAVTLEEANRVAARIFDADALHFVVVGKPEGLEAR